MSSRLLLACFTLGATACNNAVTVQLMTGPQTFELAASAVALPTELRDTSSGSATIRSIDCSMTGICPSSAEIPVTCDPPPAEVCNPAAHTVSVPVGDVVDFDVLLSDARTLLRLVDAIEIVEVTYSVSPNSLSIPLPDVSIYWGPEGAADIGAPGVTFLGTIPGVAASTSGDGMMAIDPAGSAAMSDYVVGVSRVIRFFAETQIDLEPGGPFPAGSATLTANMTVRAIGRIID